MILVHHLADSRSQRILWLLEELGVEYDVSRSERDPETLLGPTTFKEVHPVGKWPVIEDDGFMLSESGAIVEYLIAQHASDMRPTGDREVFANYLKWLHFAEASLQPLLFMRLIFARLPERAPKMVRPVVRKMSEAVTETLINPRTEEQLQEVDRHLAGRDWFAGDALTGADIMMIFPLEAALARVPGAGAYSNMARFVAAVHQRPAYQRALERGGPYAYGPQDAG